MLNNWPIAGCNEPAGLAIDTAHKRLFAGCHNQVIAVVDYTNGKVVATIPIGTGVDANRYDPGTGLVFASCGDGTITVAHEDSPDKYTVVQTIMTQRGARTMALDTKNHNVYTVTPGIPGDSGSAFLDSTGKALGILSTVEIAPIAGSNGVGDVRLELMYMHAHSSFTGVQLALGTQPFTGNKLPAG